MVLFKIISTKFLSNSYTGIKCLSRRISLFRKKPEEDHYIIHRPQPDEYCEILRLCWQCYFPEEPTIMSLGLGHCHNPVLEEDTLRALSEGLSLVARCKYTGDIVGGSINRTSCPWEPDEMERFSCAVTSPKLKSLITFYAHIQRAPDLWNTFCTDKIYEISQLFVKKEERQKGLAYKLVEASRELGADCGFRVIRMDATSAYMIRICEKLGMKLAYSLPYEDYVNIEGNPVIRPGSPHDMCNVYIDVPHSIQSKSTKWKKKWKKQ